MVSRENWTVFINLSWYKFIGSFHLCFVIFIVYFTPCKELTVTLREMIDLLDAEVFVGHDKLDLDITKAGCSDSMSDVQMIGQAGMLLLTGQTNPHAIQTAHNVGIAAVIIVRGKRPLSETVQLAKELQMPLLSTKYILFETAGRLYSKGVVGNVQKIE